MPALFHRLPQNFLRIFCGLNLLWHALAILLTVAIVSSGLDWDYFLNTRSPICLKFALLAIVAGTFMPLLAILILVLAGSLGRKPRFTATAWALAQAALLGYVISSACKAVTGRLPPPHFEVVAASRASLEDTSHGFQFGFLRGGIFWGWPSSHTTIAFAISFCVVTLYPKNKPVVFAAVAYAIYIGLGVSVTIHWLSEFVAGAIIGTVIGITVGRSFKSRIN